LSVAEHNIGSADGKSLNATSRISRRKVRSFMAEARDAAKIEIGRGASRSEKSRGPFARTAKLPVSDSTL